MSVAAPNSEAREAEDLRRAQAAHEPSMEEILASIRAIIADDREPPPAPKPGPQIVYSSDAPARPQLEPTPPPAAATVVWARPAPEPVVVAEEEPLLSQAAGAAVGASFEALSTRMAQQGMEVAERLTREMLRPMLKAWLDENLPPLVERLVRAEIARVTRGLK